jgi:hypothetical protein
MDTSWVRSEYRLLSLTVLALFFFLVGYSGGRQHMASAVYGPLKMDHAQGVETIIVGVNPDRSEYVRMGGWDLFNPRNGHTIIVCSSKERARKVVEKCVEAWAR